MYSGFESSYISNSKFDHSEWKECGFSGEVFTDNSLCNISCLVLGLNNKNTKNCNFSDSKLELLMIAKANVSDSQFENCLIKKISAREITMAACIFDHSCFEKGHFDSSTVSKISVKNTSFNETEFNNCTLKDIDFTTAIIHSIKFIDCTFENVTFTEEQETKIIKEFS